MGTKTATASSTLMSSSEDSLASTQPLDPPSSTSMTLMEMVDLKTRKTTPCTSDLTTSGTSSPPTRTETASTQFLIPMLDQNVDTLSKAEMTEQAVLQSVPFFEPQVRSEL